jgi:hypothetical protein
MTITYDDMVRAEKEALQMLKWELLKITPISIIHHLLSMGAIISSETTQEGHKIDEARLAKFKTDALLFCSHAS